MLELSGNIIFDQEKLNGDIQNILLMGVPGKSAYQYALEAGYTGTEEEFAHALTNLNDDFAIQIVENYLAENPPEGKSAFAFAQEAGYIGTEEEFAKDLSLVGSLSENDVRSYGVLPGTDCSEALQAAVKDGGEFYFPAGRYEFYNVEITKDTVFRLHPDAEFHSEKASRMIKAFECSFSMYGGKVSSGTEYPDRANTPYLHESRVRIASEYYGIIVLYGCHDCVIEGVKVPYSSHSSVFMVYGDHSGEDGKDRSINVKVGGEYRNPARSKNIAFRRCSFNNFLLSAIAVRYGNDNILIEDCSFKDALRENRMDADGNLVLVDYAYCVVTGVSNVSTVDYDDGTPGDAYIGYTPTNGYVVRNCYVKNCEGTAIDSHGASNVIYEGNTLIDCDSFITAYWDYKRVKTATGWAMENITVRNNFCRTTKAFDYAANGYPHNPFMLHSNGPLGMMRNVLIENNVIDTNWYYTSSSGVPWNMVEIYYVDNIVFRNNVFKSTGASACLTSLNGCRNVEMDNITLIGTFYRAVLFYTTLCRLGKFDCSSAVFTNAMFEATKQFYSVVDTDSLRVIGTVGNMFANWQSVMNCYGKPLQEVNGILPLDDTSYSTYPGFVGKDLTVQTSIVSRTANTVTTGSCRFLPGTRVIVGESAYYVVKVESNADKTRYTYTLDKNLGASGQTATYVSLSVPYIDIYKAGGAGGSGGSGSGGGADWNAKEGEAGYIANKPDVATKAYVDNAVDAIPVGESPTGSDTLTWDGNTEGLTSVLDMLYKVSDSIIPAEALANGFKYKFNNGLEAEESLEGLVSMGFPVTDDGFIFGGNFMVVPYDNYDLSAIEMEGITCSKGVYFASTEGMFVSELYIPGYAGFPTFKKLDEKYLPETIATKAYVEELIGGIENGSY